MSPQAKMVIAVLIGALPFVIALGGGAAIAFAR